MGVLRPPTTTPVGPPDDAGWSGPACQTGRVSAPDPSTRAATPDALAALGPFFAVDRHEPAAFPPSPWQSIGDLAAPGEILRARVRRVRSALAARGRRSPDQVELRVAVSVAHLGLVARLIAPAVGAAALGDAIDLTVDRIWWQDEWGGPYPLSVPAPVPVPVRVPVPTEPWTPDPIRLFGSAVEAITRAFLAAYSVSPRVLWGNVASAAVSAAGLTAAARPDLAAAARAAADAVLADERVEDGALRAGPGFRRRSCCLIYRLARSTAAACGDCVLAA